MRKHPLLALIPAVLLVTVSLMPQMARAAGPYIVNTVSDTVDVNTTDDACLDINNECSLRAAIMQANADGEQTTILLDESTYDKNGGSVDPLEVTISGSGGDSEGDLDITGMVTLIGSDPATTFITATMSDRVFEVHSGAELSINNVSLSGGSALIGGGIYNSGELLLDNVLVDTNTAAAVGGGIYNESNARIIDSTISHNTSTGGVGGGLYNNADATMTMSGSSVLGNTAQQEGGGISSDALSTTESTVGLNILDSTISGNTSTSADGGGIATTGRTMIQQSTISDNTSATAKGGGLLVGASANVLLENSTISGNFAAQHGGGIALTNSGSIDTLQLTHVSVIGNDIATGNGSGVYLGSIAPSDSVQILASVLAYNTINGLAFEDIGGSVAVQSMGYNVVADDGSFNEQTFWQPIGSAPDQYNVSTTNLHVNTTLKANGGSTQTHEIENSSSVLIDFVPAAHCVVTEDQRGEVRSDEECDIGAYEFEGDDDGDGVLDVNDCDRDDNSVGEEETYLVDADGDRYADSETAVELCPADASGFVLASQSRGLDIDPTDPNVSTTDDLPEDTTPLEPEDRSTTDLSTLDVTDASVFAVAVTSMEGRQNGIARVSLTDGRILNHQIFSRGRRAIKLDVLPQSGVGVAIAGGGKSMKLFNPYTGEVYDSVRLSKKKRKARNMKFLNLRRDGKKIVVTLKKKKKAKATRVVVVAFNTQEQTLRKRAGKNVKGVKAIRVQKTRRGRKANRIVLKNRRNKTKAILKVKRTYKMKQVR